MYHVGELVDLSSPKSRAWVTWLATPRGLPRRQAEMNKFYEFLWFAVMWRWLKFSSKCLQFAPTKGASAKWWWFYMIFEFLKWFLLGTSSTSACAVRVIAQRQMTMTNSGGVHTRQNDDFSVVLSGFLPRFSYYFLDFLNETSTFSADWDESESWEMAKFGNFES